MKKNAEKKEERKNETWRNEKMACGSSFLSPSCRTLSQPFSLSLFLPLSVCATRGWKKKTVEHFIPFFLHVTFCSFSFSFFFCFVFCFFCTPSTVGSRSRMAKNNGWKKAQRQRDRGKIPPARWYTFNTGPPSLSFFSISLSLSILTAPTRIEKPPAQQVHRRWFSSSSQPFRSFMSVDQGASCNIHASKLFQILSHLLNSKFCLPQKYSRSRIIIPVTKLRKRHISGFSYFIIIGSKMYFDYFGFLAFFSVVRDAFCIRHGFFFGRQWWTLFDFTEKWKLIGVRVLSSSILGYMMRVNGVRKKAIKCKGLIAYLPGVFPRG